MYYSVCFLFMFLISCSPQKFTNTNKAAEKVDTKKATGNIGEQGNQPTATPKVAENSTKAEAKNKPVGETPFPSPENEKLPMWCDNIAEKKQIFKIKGNAKGSLLFPLSCSKETQETASVVNKKPVDIIFVVDVTKSFADIIDAVKNNIITFADNLDKKFWDPKFGAVTFRDTPNSTDESDIKPGIPLSLYELMYKFPFNSAKNLKADIDKKSLKEGQEWFAYDKSDNQEAGLEAISEALSMFKSYGRANAEQVLFFTTNSPSFFGLDHQNLSVNALSQKLKNFDKLRFFHSTDTSLPLLKGFETTAPEYTNSKEQIKDLLKMSQYPSSRISEFEFPVTKTNFNNLFIGKFEQVSQKINLNCYLISAEIKDVNNKVVYNKVGDLSWSLGLIDNKDSLFSSDTYLSKGVYTYKENRCCIKSGDLLCSDVEENTVNIEIK